MDKKSKIIVTAAIVFSLTAAGAGAFWSISKADTTGTNPMTSLVNAIAQRFGLNVSDVQQVFDQQRAQMQAQRQQEMAQSFADKISQAVKDGKLTQDQADKITAKKTELDAFKTSLQGKTKAEIQAAMKTEMASLKQWMTDNNIPQGYLPFGGFGMMGRHGGMMGEPTTTPAPAASSN